MAPVTPVSAQEDNDSIQQCDQGPPIPDQDTDTDDGFSDDFEDGDAEGWRNVDGDVDAEIREASFEGQYSAYGNSTMISQVDNPAFEWVGGPVLDTSDDFDVSGTFRYAIGESTDVQNVRIGLTGDDQSQEGENALLLFDYGSGETRLGTHIQDDQGEAIPNDFQSQWTEFRIQSNAGYDTLRAKVWMAGNVEPSDWQIERSGFAGQSGSFGFNPGDSSAGSRQMWLDSVALEGTEEGVSESQLTIDTRSLFQPGETHEYTVTNTTVREDGTTETEDVTAEASVNTSNTSLLTADEQAAELIATNDPNASAGVVINASHGNATGCVNAIVASATMENLDILPTVYRVTTFLGDWTVFLFIVSIGAGIVGTRIATSFMGLSMMELVLIVGWFGGYISTGLIMTSVFACLFIGLNLAANIDYQVQR